MTPIRPICQRFPILPHVLPSLLLAIVLTVLVCWNPFGAPPQTACLHVLIKTSASGAASLDTDVDGLGLGGRPSISSRVVGGGQVNHLRFEFMAGELHSFVLTPLDRPGLVEIQRCWLATSDDRLIAEIPPSGLAPGENDYREKLPDGSVRVGPRGGALVEPLSFGPPKPINVAVEVPPSAGKIALVLVLSFAGFLGVSLALERGREKLLHLGETAHGWASGRPRLAILLVAAIAVGLATFPVIFLGKSFVSPDNGVSLLYPTFPTVPGAEGGHMENPAGSDLHATMYWHLPVSVMEHQAIFQDGEFPLWNRFSWAGYGLLGQGMSMIGDPLHVAVILAGSKAWAWDVKFVVARFLFALGIGWLVFRTSRSLGAALLLTISAPFIGFFFYRYCHLANISLCYSPWILLAWVEGVRARTLRRAALWSGLLIFANWWELNSGTAKESSALILFLNAAGGLMMLLAHEPWRWRAARLAAFAWASVVFLLLSAPLWLVFLDTLSKAWSIYDTPKVFQIQPGLMIGLFDDIFFRQLVPSEYVFDPSLNFFVLLGVGWALVRLRALAQERLFLAALLAAFFLAAIAFGVVSPTLLATVPILRNISHFDNTFSCVLFILLFVIAGYGLREGIARINRAEWRGDWLLVITFVGILLAAYFGFTQASHRVGRTFLAVGETLPKSPFFLRYVPALAGALAFLPWAGRQVLLRRPAAPTWALAALCLFVVLHFRHGMYGQTKFDLYTMNPQKRLELQKIASPAIAHLHAAMKEPARVLGTGFTMSVGFNAIQGLESLTAGDALMNPRMIALVDALGIPRVDGWRIAVHRHRYEALHRSLDMLNVRYLLSSLEKPELPQTRLLGKYDLILEESPTAWPRAFFTDTVGSFPDVATLGKMVRGGDGRPFAAMPPAAQARLPAFLRREAGGQTVVAAANYHLTNNTTTFEIDAPTPGLAVLMEANVPGDILVSVDGQPAECLTVDYAFRGVVIDRPGRHVIQFRYWPAILEPALSLGAVGLACLLLSGWVLWRTRRPMAGPSLEKAPVDDSLATANP